MTVRARWLLTVLVVLVWAVLGGPSDGLWLAMPPLLAVVVEYAVIALYSTLVQQVIMAAVMVYGAVNARENARRARNRARDAYNASLQDRLATVMSAQAPLQVVYGEAVVGGAIVAVLTSGDKDQYKHVVVVWAAHECEAITEFYVNGYSAGARDADGNVLYGKYAVGETDTVTVDAVVSGTGAINLSGVVGAQRVLSVSDGGFPPYTLGGSECTLTGSTVQIGPTHVAYWAGKSVRVTVDLSATSSRLRVRHFLGSADQAADGMTMAECPDWTSTDRLRGLCYSIVRLDLNEQEFQGGPPQMTARVKGRKVHDPRTGTTAWSANPALCIADFLQAQWGKQALSTQLVTSSVIASANACDEDLVLHYGKRYTCNGAFRTDSDPDETLNALAQSMAGFVTYTGAWHLQAGVWTAPVMDLGDAENAGAVQGVAGDSALQVFNGLRGQFFDPARADQLTDYPPYRNAGFVAEDGGELWEDLPLPFSDSDWRAHNLARIHVERSRGMTLVVPCKRVALKLRVGQRVRYSNSLLQITAQPFRVVKREYRLGQPVMLTLAQDAEDFYDEVDAPAPLSSPALYEADPFRVAAVAGLAAESGTATLLLQTDGTVLSRVRVTCTPAEDALVLRGGALQVEWRRDQDDVWQRAPEASGAESEAWLLGLEEGRLYVLRARWRNALGVVGDWRSTTVLHLGKTEPPGVPVGLVVESAPGGALVKWTPCPDPDYLESTLLLGDGEDLEDAVQIWQGAASSYLWLQPLAGTYKLWLVHRDTSGNQSPPATASITLAASAGQILLSPSAAVFAFNSAGVATPAGQSVTFTAVLSGMTGTITWTAALYDAAGGSLGSATLTGSGGTRALAVAAFGAAARCVVTAAVGAASAQAVVVRVKDGAAGANGANGANGSNGADGANGSNGADGTQTAEVALWVWSTSTPGNPSGASTYTWLTGEHASYTGGNGWSTSVPSNPGTPGLRLYRASKGITATAGTSSSSVSWASGYAVAAWSSNGAAGLQAAQPTVYQWAASIPAGPSGAATWTWSSSSFGAAPSGWSLTPGTSPSVGYTLWAATVALSDSASSGTTNFNWTSAAITARGYAGSNGQQGASARYAYARIAGNPSPTSGIVMHSGDSPPSNAESIGNWNVNAVWSTSDPNPSSSNTLYQTDGIWDPATGLTAWSTPYISSLKVGSLSAITTSTGTLTADGDIVTTSGSIRSATFPSGGGWPSGAGVAGFCLDKFGIKLGDNPGGKYFQVTQEGNVYAPGFTIINGSATFSGSLSAASGTFAGALSAVTGSFGTVTMSGLLYTPGKSNYDSGNGVMIGYQSGESYLGVTSTASGTLKGMWIRTGDGVLNVTGAVISNSTVNFSTFSASVSGGGSTSGNSGSGFLTTSFGGAYVTPSGGTAPYSYLWSVQNQDLGTVTLSSVTSSSTSVTARTPYGGATQSSVTCMVTDANGRTAVATVLYTVTNGPV